ncbi:CvpA family protein [Desemzia sp. FAM 23991]|uniref:CvpA family protein n=1 Tax=unclassified Desemzia TaxID=2685243 RepID=UPI00388A1F4C
MWMTIGIIVFLLIGIYSGARRGLVLQLILSLGFLASYYFAGKYYLALSEYLQLMIPYPSASLNDSFVFYNSALGLQLDEAFYHGISFLLILFIGWLLTRFIGGLAQGVKFLPIVKQANSIGGAVLSGIVSYVGIFLVLFVLTMLPIDFIQEQFANSALARMIVENTPALSNQIYNWWVSTII